MVLDFYVTYIFLISAVILSIKGFSDSNFVDKYVFHPYRVKHNKEWYRFLSHAFLHGDPAHLIFNAVTIFSFGRIVEMILQEIVGSAVLAKIIFLVYCIVSIIVSSLISYFRNANNFNYRSLGISGMASAIVFTSIMWYPQGKILIPIPMPAWVYGILYLAFEIYSDRKRNNTGIAHDAHIAGAVFGILFAIIFNFDQVRFAFSNLF